jgi:MinD superfamily P-loop ATPase
MIALSGGDLPAATHIEFQRAAREADARHAVATLAALSDSQRSHQFIRRLGVRTLAVCEREGVAGVAELRDVLSAA